MPASRHPEQVGHIPADYQLPERSDTVGNLEWSVSRILPDYSQSGGCSRYSDRCRCCYASGYIQRVSISLLSVLLFELEVKSPWAYFGLEKLLK